MPASRPSKKKGKPRRGTIRTQAADLEKESKKSPPKRPSEKEGECYEGVAKERIRKGKRVQCAARGLKRDYIRALVRNAKRLGEKIWGGRGTVRSATLIFRKKVQGGGDPEIKATIAVAPQKEVERDSGIGGKGGRLLIGFRKQRATREGMGHGCSHFKIKRERGLTQGRMAVGTRLVANSEGGGMRKNEPFTRGLWFAEFSEGRELQGNPWGKR